MNGIIKSGISGFLVWFLLGTGIGEAQQSRSKPPKPSSNTSWDARMDDMPSTSSRKDKVIFKYSLSGTLSGNRCVEEVTQKMGFHYELLPKTGPGSKTELGMFFHNLGTRTLLTFKNGPFWSFRLKKRIKECRKRTGDYMG